MRISFLLFICLAVSVAHAEGAGKHLFILSGQSNMAFLDLDASFTPTVKAAFGDGNVTVVKSAQGGQPIRRWYKGWESAEGEASETTGDLYELFMRKVRSATKGQVYDTVTFLWMQGERDAREGNGEVYAESLRGVVHQLEEDLGREDIYVVIGRLSDFGMNNSMFPDWILIREVQVKVAEEHPYWAWVNTDDLNDGYNQKGRPISNDLHYSVEGYEIFGKRLADEAIKLIKMNEIMTQ